MRIARVHARIRNTHCPYSAFSAPSFLSSRLLGDILISTRDFRTPFMAQLVVRDLEDDVKRGLQRRAMVHGRSMEAEVRDILRAAVAEPMSSPAALGTRIANRFRGQGLDAPIEEVRSWRVRLPDLEE